MKDRTNEELNRIIAEWRGWTWYAPGQAPVGYPQYGWWQNPKPRYTAGFTGELESPPNYCSDLNAMHDAEGRLTESLRMPFALKLSKEKYDNAETTWRVVHATARQRAEALVAVIEQTK